MDSLVVSSRQLIYNKMYYLSVDGKEIMICGQRPAGFVYAQVHKNNQQTTGRALGKGSGSLPQSSTLVTSCTMSQLDNDGELSTDSCSLNWGGQSGTD